MKKKPWRCFFSEAMVRDCTGCEVCGRACQQGTNSMVTRKEGSAAAV